MAVISPKGRIVRDFLSSDFLRIFFSKRIKILNSIVDADARAAIAQKGALDDNEMTGEAAGGPLRPPSCKNVVGEGRRAYDKTAFLHTAAEPTNPIHQFRINTN